MLLLSHFLKPNLPEIEFLSHCGQSEVFRCESLYNTWESTGCGTLYVKFWNTCCEKGNIKHWVTVIAFTVGQSLSSLWTLNTKHVSLCISCRFLNIKVLANITLSSKWYIINIHYKAQIGLSLFSASGTLPEFIDFQTFYFVKIKLGLLSPSVII